MDFETLKTKMSSIAASFPERWVVTSDVQVNGQPFTHLIIDNFFTEDELKEIQLREANVTGKEIKIAHSLMKKGGDVESDIFDKDFLTHIDNDYRPHLENILGVIAEGKKTLYEYADFHLITTGPDYEHAIHDDIPKKLLSVVVYISPDHNNGTFIHDDRYNKTPVGEVEWKRNRAFIFSRLDRKTWHSYSANKVDNRFCVIYNLNTYKAYRGHWAEGNFLKYLEKRIKNE